MRAETMMLCSVERSSARVDLHQVEKANSSGRREGITQRRLAMWNVSEKGCRNQIHLRAEWDTSHPGGGLGTLDQSANYGEARSSVTYMKIWSPGITNV